MLTIVGPRGSGKTQKLFKVAEKNNAMILTPNSRALRVKAKDLGYNNLEIIGFGDLDNDNFSLNKNVLVDNAEYVLKDLLNKFYSINMTGFTANLEDNNET